MKNRILVLGAIAMALSLTSCRESSDTLLAYDYDDNLAFGEGYTSFGGKYEIAWNALNQYYSLWDYERQNGLDWDSAYAASYPKFAALDKRGTDNPVTDKELEALMNEAFSDLHDGHMYITFLNHHNNNSSVMVSPSDLRNANRDDMRISTMYKPDISKYYLAPANGEVVVDEKGQPQTAFYSTIAPFMMYNLMHTEGMGYMWVCDQIEKYSALPKPTVEQLEKLNALKELKAKLADEHLTLSSYNTLVVQYAYLKVPGLTVINSSFQDEGMAVRYALLKGNIAYFYFSQFSLSTYMTESGMAKLDKNDPNLLDHVQGISTVWQAWFNAIQALGKTGKLGGVIIDLRGNQGGSTNDFQFALGALRPSGGMLVGKERFKRGTGRLDYSTPMPAVMDTYTDEHYVVDDQPIVILTNCRSVSMSEMTALSAKSLKNAKIIGKRTWGGLCGLTSNRNNTLSYSGKIGVEDITPVFVYCPTLAQMTNDGQILEGVGITPDIEVDFDDKQFLATGKDSQLERALQYIRSGQ